VTEVGKPSQLGAWAYLVWLTWQRQARARQMVWIALGLLAFAGTVVAINTAAGRWGMHHWRYPRRWGPTFPVWIDKTQVVLSLVHRSPEAQGLQHGVLGCCRTLISPDARATLPGQPKGEPPRGPVLAWSGFLVFAQWVVFGIFLTFLLPLWSLSFATEALGGERESNSLVWLLTRPLARPGIYLARFVALLPWSLGLALGGFALLCLAAGPPGRPALRLFWPAVFWSALAFSALFYLMGAFFRRPAVLALVYSFCLEVVLGNMPGYLKRLSIGFYARCMMYDAASGSGLQPEKPSVFLPVDGPTALLVLAATTVVLLGVGMAVFARSQYREVV
jgi:hypothetical protein